ncbi:MAG TPA: MFS transporter [Myxococcota bacterium]|nr:MFS transporter [Myxococcota bacterium]
MIRRRTPAAPSLGYSRYVLGVLVVVYVLNFLDRQIISILAEQIKADLHIDDSQIGFLYGTAFAVFYAIFGIPLGRLADVWDRRTLIAWGLAFWSAMTALSGLSRNFPELASSRIGVGVGEASATPAAFSMLADSFPARLRATVLAIYSSGIYIGAGLGLAIGGQIVDRWNAAWPSGQAPFGLTGWQAAYLAVGLPGLAIALWVRSLREPVRGAQDGVVSASEPHPFREAMRELRAVLPPFTLWNLVVLGAGARGVVRNLATAAAIALGAAVLIRWTGSVAQWAALGLGIYSACSWVQSLRLRDPPAAELILGSRAFRYASLGFASVAFVSYGLGFWVPIHLIRDLKQTSAQVGTIAGLSAALAGFLGVTSGGMLADRLRRRSVVGRLQVGLVTATAPLPLILWLLGTDSARTVYILNFPISILVSMWIGAGASTIADLVLPRMRAVAAAFYILFITFIGLALGPYTIGRLSVWTGDLAMAMRMALILDVAACGFLLLAMRHLARDEASLRERAKAAGERLEEAAA